MIPTQLLILTMLFAIMGFIRPHKNYQSEMLILNSFSFYDYMKILLSVFCHLHTALIFIQFDI